MAKEKKSRLAAKLRELGFEPLSEEAEAYMKHRTERRLQQRFGNTITRKERRIVAKEMKRPRFLIFGGENTSTHATDDTGKNWILCGSMVDLEPFGFQNSAVLMPVVAQMLPLPPQKNH